VRSIEKYILIQNWGWQRLMEVNSVTDERVMQKMTVGKYTEMRYVIIVAVECTIFSLFSGYPGSKSRIGTRF